ncbi:N-terminal domain of NEFA-interacting nuclear protein NIP30-domain-containing protein [Lasiosphaeris hirsuta]|uniref:N-terminal domain of NEFA-interacting nuclear protein NIP30-domain-containing protein n=1 Tax=Lasiosphaeris hirsuta TaxID=260670 RepID=A0AA40DVL3_9PEZI|nr:N-terminal domain of NEFA-interacting nuclear protein NIP30-domain-containing protein [Lasiosphaeris hirsuta]
MSSRFVSAGAIDAATGEAAATTSSTSSNNPPAAEPSSARENKKALEWLEVQKQLEAARAGRALAAAAPVVGPNGEKSLFEVLQANKAAKQAAFEESSRIRNQFRALDDDEVDFLEGVREQKRAEEERARRELEEGLKAFRERGGERGEGEREGEGEEEVDVGWAVVGGRKRRRGEREAGRKRVKGMVVAVAGGSGGSGGRRAPEGEGGVSVKTGVAGDNGKEEGVKPEGEGAAPAPIPTAAPVSAPKKLGGLVDYGSSDDEDD